MEVILLEKVHKLGELGDKVKVKGGFGRNFLIPTKKAVPATAEHLEKFEAMRAKLEVEQKDILGRAKGRARQLEELPEVTISSKAGEEGKLYGSIGTADIADAITSAGVALEKKEVKLPDGPLRDIGEHEVSLRLHADVNVSIKVNVVAEA